MRRLFNLSLILFLACAVLDLGNLAAIALSLYFPSFPGRLAWIACYLCGTLAYIGLGLNPRLPKTVVIPQLLWLLWRLLEFWPMESLVGDRYPLVAAASQLILGLILLQLNRLNFGQLLIPDQKISLIRNQTSNRLIFVLVNILLLPIILLLLCFSVATYLLENATADFVSLKPNGLYLAEQIYHRKNKQIHLMAMIHLARPEYYAELNLTVPEDNTLILLEGVTDNNKLMTHNFSYGAVADLLGLTEQQGGHFYGRLIRPEDLSNPQPSKTVDLLPADVDLSALSPHTIKILNALAKYVLGSASPAQGYGEFSRWAEQNLSPDYDVALMRDLLDKRNRQVMSYLPRALKKYDHLVIPWGALHMKGIEQELLKRGFVLKKRRERLSVDFFALPYGEIWGKLMGKRRSLSSSTSLTDHGVEG